MTNSKVQISAVLVLFLIHWFIPLPSLAMNTTINGALGDLDGNGDGGAGEAAVVQTAVNCWDARITTNRNFTLTVSGASLTGRGVGGTTTVTGGIPTAGFATMDNDGSVNWFVDPTPLASLEFTPDPNNQWRFINGTVASGANQADLLRSVAHEIGHANGWICGSAACSRAPDNPNYDGLMNPAPGAFVANTTVNLRNAATAYNVPLRGDGVAGGIGTGGIVNELSHTGPAGPTNSVADLMFGRTGNGVRETPSVNDVNMFVNSYGDTVNLPPTVNSGVDQIAECNSVGGANVTLDASGSTDPDGDSLTYSWTCPGATLSTPNAATTNAFVALNQSVTCRVDATDLAVCPADADTVNVSVVDTTDPAISCPTPVVVECSSFGGTPDSDAGISGFLSGASAADTCDASLTVSNDAPSFFSLGTTPVDFTAADDSGNFDMCSANVTVEDTLDPTLTVPGNVTAECESPAGTAVEIGVATTSDICDASVSLANDAPALFPLGATTVTWTATDDSGNDTSDTQTVSIVDTTPPDFELSVTPDVLWSPNHKLVTVQAHITMLTDTCDASPTVTLVSITSSEADNGQGDGNTDNDIQGADFGTDDREFQLRSERSGQGSGRIYTITYRVEDDSGNKTTKQATVTVPHSLSSL